MADGLSKVVIPVLPGWVSLPVAAAQLDVKRQRLFQMIDEGKLTTVHRIPGAGSRPAAYVVRVEEVNRLLAEQKAAEARVTASEVPVPVGA